jgi:hypothetical protein
VQCGIVDLCFPLESVKRRDAKRWGDGTATPTCQESAIECDRGTGVRLREDFTETCYEINDAPTSSIGVGLRVGQTEFTNVASVASAELPLIPPTAS